MKNKKWSVLVLTLMLALTWLTGCTGSASPGSGISVTDMEGREVQLSEPATKVVALTAADCEILYAVGAGSALVGRGEFCDYPAEVLDVVAVQSGSETNIEQIISLKPNAVLMASMAQSPEQVEALESAGIPVVVSNAQDIAGVYTAIQMIGTVVGKDAEAKALVEQMKSGFQAVADKVADSQGEASIYFEVSPLEYGLWTSGKSTFMDEISTMLGLTNVFADIDGWAEISQEQVIERNPDHIVTIAMYFGEGTPPADEIMGRSGWDAITAIVEKQVYNLDGNEFSRPGPRLVDAANSLFNAVYDAAQ